MLTFRNLDAAYRWVLSATIDAQPTCPRGMPTRELTNVSIRIQEPRRRFVTIPARGWKLRLALGELAWHLSASQNVEPLASYTRAWARYSVDEKIVGSCYGHLIFGQRGATSQWQKCKALLEADRDSRRAVFQLYDPAVNYIGSPDVSCTLSMQFMVRNNLLDCTVIMRSNDVYFGFPYDVFFYTTLQEMMAAELGLELGGYCHFATSMHLYEKDVHRALAVINDPSEADFSDFKLRLPAERKLFCDAEAHVRSRKPPQDFIFEDDFWAHKYQFLIGDAVDGIVNSKYRTVFSD